jgi:tetratricopeptide (TPR) repeat protein
VKANCIVPIGLSAVFPGVGHIAAGRPARGLLLVFLFGFAIDGYLYSQAQTLLPPERTTISPGSLRGGALALGGLLWAIAIADSAAAAFRCRRMEARSGLANTHIREALVAYLRNDPAAATQSLRAALRISPRDPDALFYLGVIYAKSGHSRKARKALYRCIRYDTEGKWDDEAHEQLGVIEGASQSSSSSSSSSFSSSTLPSKTGKKIEDEDEHENEHDERQEPPLETPA